jgi:hypothetical protein
MVTTVSDYKTQNDPGLRDRLDRKVYPSLPIEYWIAPVKPEPTARLWTHGYMNRCIDRNHPRFYAHQRLRNKATHPRSRRALGDEGSLFVKESVSLTCPLIVDEMQHYSGDYFRGVYGVLAPTNIYKSDMQNLHLGNFPSFPVGLGIDMTDLWGLGSTAIAKSLPDVPEFSLFRFIGELRQGLPKIPMALLAKEKKLRNVGGEYLNYQFGIAPLISDVQKLFEALQDPALRKAVKHQLNEEHRVRKTIAKDVTSTRRILTTSEMSTMNRLTGLTGFVDTDLRYRIWSSCSFAYYQTTELDRLLNELDQVLGGLGAVPRAIDVWNLLPWSWLVDWFTNINHVVTNLSYLGRDGLYLERGYIMAEYSLTETSVSTGMVLGRPFVSKGVRSHDRKYRTRASPFGFGLTWKDFSPYQTSILAALGVSRLRY